METTKITEKGQVTIPKLIREKLHLIPGDKIEWIMDNGGSRLRKIRSKEKLMESCDVVQMNPEEYETIMEDIRPSLE